MKIEKVNENQIRCTLTREDLDNRHLKLSELAYGTEKAKSLFRDMMRQAAYQFGFDAEDIPLMIEAVPVSSDSIILLITKVEYPEELDTRFSKFSESDDDLESYFGYDEDFPISDAQAEERADDILDLFRRIQQEKEAEQTETQPDSSANFIPLDEAVRQKEHKKKQAQAKTAPASNDCIHMARLFAFDDLQPLMQFSNIAQQFYRQPNTLYKNPSSGRYYLLVNNGSSTPETFNRLCNILSEYGTPLNLHVATSAFMQEHYQTIISEHALETLSTL